MAHFIKAEVPIVPQEVELTEFTWAVLDMCAERIEDADPSQEVTLSHLNNRGIDTTYSIAKAVGKEVIGVTDTATAKQIHSVLTANLHQRLVLPFTLGYGHGIGINFKEERK